MTYYDILTMMVIGAVAFPGSAAGQATGIHHARG